MKVLQNLLRWAVIWVCGSYLVIIMFQIQAGRTGNRYREPRAEAGEDIEVGDCLLRFWATICCQSKVSNARLFLSAWLSDSQSLFIISVHEISSAHISSHESSVLIGIEFASSCCFCFRCVQCLHRTQWWFTIGKISTHLNVQVQHSRKLLRVSF